MRFIPSRSWVRLFHGDCYTVLDQFDDDSLDALVTDPPAGISFMGKAWDHHRGGRDQWIAWIAQRFKECRRVLKPGAHGLVWAIPRTSHWTAYALEEAGFEIREIVHHIFGSGFPKSLNISKAIDNSLGATRKIIGYDESRARPNRLYRSGAIGNIGGHEHISDRTDNGATLTAPATAEAKQWEGWGTALKPATEHWILVRKPFAGTLVKNVLRHGTGGLNIDACRITTNDVTGRPVYESKGWKNTSGLTGSQNDDWKKGRWPANLILDEAAGALLDEQSGSLTGARAPVRGTEGSELVKDIYNKRKRIPGVFHSDIGGASRFFYCPKPSRREREAGLDDCVVQQRDDSRKEGNPGGDNPRNRGVKPVKNHHPTVKSIVLMRYLTRLITPPRGTVVDPFMGSGSTGCACALENFNFVGMDSEQEYVTLARARIDYWRLRAKAHKR
jgi:DNA modification methylase